MGRAAGPWARVEAFYVGYEKEWSNIWWFKSVGGAVNNSTFNFDAAGADFAAWWDTNFAPCVHPSVRMKGLSFTSNDGTTVVGADIYTSAHVGTAVGDVIPEEVAAVVSLLAPAGGRNGRGRLYVSGLATSLIDGSYLSQITGGAAFDTLAGAMSTNFTMETVLFAHQVFSPSKSALNPITRGFRVDLLGTNRKRRARF